MSDDAAPDLLPRGLDMRQRRIWRAGELYRGRGLEIGPLHNPIAPRAKAPEVSYLDVHDRDELVRLYENNPRVPTERIPTIDFALHHGDEIRDIPGAVGDAELFDWVLASHVVEHVPDLVGWLDQVARVTVDHGRLVLVVPDRRYTFDVHRPATSLGQVLEAHESGARIPSVRAVYDHNRSIVDTTAVDLWEGRLPTYADRRHPPEIVDLKVGWARDGQYVDSHVWTFTPGAFVEQVVELRDLGLSQWAVHVLDPTPRHEHEFIAVLRRLPRDQPWTDDLLATEPARSTMPDWLDETSGWQRDRRQARANLRAARERGADLRARLAELRAQVEAERARADELEQQWRRHPAVRARRRLRRGRSG